MNPNRLKFRRTASSAGKAVAVVRLPDVGAVFMAMSWGDLRKLAIDRGLYRVGMKRSEVEAALS